MALNVLSDAKIRSIKPGDKDQWFNDGAGLYLRVRRRSKTFVLRRKHNGKTRVVTLGPWHDPQLTVQRPEALSLKDARIKALEYSPQVEQQQLTDATTVKQMASRYVRLYVDPKHKRPEMFTGYLKRSIYPALADVRVSDVTTTQLADLVEEYAQTRSPRGADQLRSVLKTLFSYGVEKGYRTDDPSASLTRRLTGYQYKPGERFLTEAEIALLWHTNSDHTPLLRWLLLTGARIGEAQRATWGRIEDTKEGVFWHIPAEHSKNGNAHWCFIPELGEEILAGQDRNREWVFAEKTNTAVQAWLRRWCEREKVTPAFTPHDLRRTFATKANEIGIPYWVVERMLNHTLEGVARVYNKAELKQERIDGSRKWANWLCELLK